MVNTVSPSPLQLLFLRVVDSTFRRLTSLAYNFRRESLTFSTNENTCALVWLGKGRSTSFPVPVTKARVTGLCVPEEIGKGWMKEGSCNQEKGILCGPKAMPTRGLESSCGLYCPLGHSQANTPPISSRPFPFCILYHMSSPWKIVPCLACLAFVGGTP